MRLYEKGCWNLCEEPIITHLLHIQSYEFHTIIDSIQTLQQSQSEWTEYNPTFPLLEICSYDRLQEWSIVTETETIIIWVKWEWFVLIEYSLLQQISLHITSSFIRAVLSHNSSTLLYSRYSEMNMKRFISLDSHFYLEWIDQDYQSLNY